MIEFHPGLILLFGAVLAVAIPGRMRQVIMVLAPILALLSVYSLQDGALWNYGFINDLNLIVLKVDPLSRVFGMIFSIAALICNIYALKVKNGGEIAAGLAYAGSALGVVYAGDWLTLFFFWD